MAFAIINGMNLKVDKAGRIVLPKPIRDRYRLREGSDVELEESPDGLLLKPVNLRPSLVKENGIWVHLGKAPSGFDWADVVDSVRDERIKDASGL
jgi:AbrB family looped-hinge helix DNA binding protein